MVVVVMVAMVMVVMVMVVVVVVKDYERDPVATMMQFDGECVWKLELALQYEKV